MAWQEERLNPDISYSSQLPRHDEYGIFGFINSMYSLKKKPGSSIQAFI
jgi:hypothetical protein